MTILIKVLKLRFFQGNLNRLRFWVLGCPWIFAF